MTKETLIEFVKENCTIYDLCDWYGISTEGSDNSQGHRMASPDGSGKNRNQLQIYDDGRSFTDFSTGYGRGGSTGGSVLDFYWHFVKVEKIPLEGPQVHEVALELAEVIYEHKKIPFDGLGADKGTVNKFIELDEATAKFESELHRPQNRDVLGYLTDVRGIGCDTLRKCKTGLTPYNYGGCVRFAFPHVDKHGHTHTVHYRISPRTANYTTLAGSKSNHGDLPKTLWHKTGKDNAVLDVPFGLWSLGELDGPIVVCEGHIDCLTAIDNGYPALTLGAVGYWNSDSGDLNKARGHLFKALRDSRRDGGRHPYCIIAFDRDKGDDGSGSILASNHGKGQMETLKLAKRLLSMGLEFKVPDIPPECNDLNGYHTSRGNSLEGLLEPENLIDGWAYMAIQLQGDFEAFDGLFRRWARHKEKAVIQNALAGVSERRVFPDEAVESLCKRACGPPTQYDIVEEITEEHEYILLNTGLYEYDGARWSPLEGGDGHLKSVINAKLGRRTDGRLINSTLTVLKAEITPTDERIVMDGPEPRLVFPNGTLHYGGGKPVFRPHRKDDYSTVVMPFEYDEEATECPTYDRVCWELSKGDPAMRRALDECGALILAPDNRFQKGYMFLGRAGNGKSLFADLLESVIGEERVTSKRISGLNGNHALEGIDRSWLNVADENRQASLKGGNGEILRNLIDGKTVEINPKNHPHYRAKTRAKWVICANNPLMGDEAPAALGRRLVVLRFDQTFSSDPDESKGEKPVDYNLLDKLKLELPAIFNRFLKTYMELMERLTVYDERLKKGLSVKGFEVFTEPELGAEYQRELLETEDPLYAFYNENFWFDGDNETFDERFYFARPADFYQSYAIWMESNGYGKKLNKQAFTKAFREIFLDEHPGWLVFYREDCGTLLLNPKRWRVERRENTKTRKPTQTLEALGWPGTTYKNLGGGSHPNRVTPDAIRAMMEAADGRGGLVLSFSKGV